MRYDAIIIGAGLSGLAAAIRLSHFGKKTLVLEAHHTPGGLNSYYFRQGKEIDAGLHAMTNFVPAGTRGAPLTKLLRQLRLRHEDLDLVEQSQSSIVFPETKLVFDNSFATLQQQVADKFPQEQDGFAALTAELAELNETSLDARPESARAHIDRHIHDPRLRDMLLCPLMYYGNSAEDDMDWTHFAVMWKSVFGSGFARPRKGMRHILGLLTQKLRENGGELRLGAKVDRLEIGAGDVESVVLASGEELQADLILSSAGWVETLRLCGDDYPEEAGQLSFAEMILFLDTPPAELGLKESIVFFSCEEPFTFRCSGGILDDGSGVVCCPENFRYDPPLADHTVRVTMKAGYPAWKRLAPREYAAAKAQAGQIMLSCAAQFMPDIAAHVTFTDLFTPLTIERYTGHVNGAIYGAPHKRRPAHTPYENLFLIGTDQGFLGIVGALLSGITVANLYGLGEESRL